MRHFIIIGFLLAAISASGQIYIDSYRFGAPLSGVLLDDYPNAAAAYSLRKLRTAYTGNCITIRRTSTGDTLAVGFSGNFLDTAALKTFCSGTNCFVRRWFDQSGNNRHVAQTTDANQPTIYVSDSIVLENGKPTLLFDGTNDRLFSNESSYGATDYSVAVVSRSGGLNVLGRAIFTIRSVTQSRNGYIHLLYRNNLTNNFRVMYTSDGDLSNTVIQNPLSTFPTTQNLITNFVPQSGSIIFSLNGTQQASSAAIGQTLNSVQFILGNYYVNNDYFHQGTINEVIIYMADQTANKSGIETNINNFYSIY
jgi:hypothetical protein